MKRLVVVAQGDGGEGQAYLDGVMAGEPGIDEEGGQFEAVVVPRRGQADAQDEDGAALAQGIVEIVANPTKVLWISAEESK
jgi:hypothetical protein